MSEIIVIDSPEQISNAFESATPNDFPNWNCHPFYGNYIRALFQSVNDRRRKYDLAYFAVVEGDKPLLLVPAASDNETVSMLGQPITLGLRAKIGKKRQKKVSRKVVLSK